jgi:hypothetical protein
MRERHKRARSAFGYSSYRQTRSEEDAEGPGKGNFPEGIRSKKREVSSQLPFDLQSGTAEKQPAAVPTTILH